MDFSNFSDNNVVIMKQTEVIVIDFVNKSALYRVKLDNYSKNNDLEYSQINSAIDLCKNNYQISIKNPKQKIA